jgi:hypothetical protein
VAPAGSATASRPLGGDRTRPPPQRREKRTSSPLRLLGCSCSRPAGTRSRRRSRAHPGESGHSNRPPATASIKRSVAVTRSWFAFARSVESAAPSPTGSRRGGDRSRSSRSPKVAWGGSDSSSPPAERRARLRSVVRSPKLDAQVSRPRHMVSRPEAFLSASTSSKSSSGLTHGVSSQCDATEDRSRSAAGSRL